MAAISSNGTGGGLASAATSWAGGVVPATLDAVTILAGDTITIDGVQSWNSLTNNGLLSYSRSVSSSLTLATASSLATGAGTFDMGTAASPIPAAVNADLILTGLAVQYSVLLDGTFTAHGAITKSRSALTTLVTSTTVFDCDDITGWVVGDNLAFEHPNKQIDINAYTANIISVVSTGGKSGTVTMDAPTPAGYAFFVGQVIVNLTSHVTIKSADPTEAYNTSNPQIVVIRYTWGTTSDNKFHCENIAVNGLGSNGATAFYFKTMSGFKYKNNLTLDLVGCAFRNCNAIVQSDAYHTLSNVSYFNNVTTSLGTYAMRNNGGSYATDISCINCYGLLSNYMVCVCDNLRFVNGGKLRYRLSTVIEITGGIIRSMYSLGELAGTTACVFSNMSITNMSRYFDAFSSGTGVLANCTTDIVSNYITGSMAGAFIDAKLADHSGASTDQRQYSFEGAILRDTAISSASTPVASIRLQPAKVGDKLKYKTVATVLAGQTLTVSCELRKDAAYNGTSTPTLHASGESTVSASMSVANDLFETVSVTTPVAIKTHTVTISIETIGTAGNAWADNLTIGGKVFDIGQDLWGGLGTEVSNIVDITLTGKSVNINGLVPGSDVVILQAGTNTVLASVDQEPTSSWIYSAPSAQTIDIGIIKPGYVTQYIYGYALNQLGGSLPIKQLPDRSYI